MPTLNDLITPLGGVIGISLSQAALQEKVVAVTADSRESASGVLFVALKGSGLDGHAFVGDAMDRGCRAVVVEQGRFADTSRPGLIVVEDSHRALAELAALFHGSPADFMRLIGITGTNGKTTITWLVEQMLVQAGLRPGVIGTVNYRCHTTRGEEVLQSAPLTTPDPITLQRTLATMKSRGVTHVLMEVSSHALVQQRLGTLRFHVGCFTNLSRDHLDYHRDMESYFAAKKLLFSDYLRPGARAVIIVDDGARELPYGRRLAAELGAQALTCGGLDSADVRAEGLTQSLEGFSCQVHCGGEQASLRSRLAGSYNVQNMLCAVGIGHALGLDLAAACAALAEVVRVPGRLERVRIGGLSPDQYPAVFVDYAHTPDALENVLSGLRQLIGGRLICVFGCGGNRDRGKRPLMGRIAADLADAVVVTSDNPRTERAEDIIADITVGIREAGLRELPLTELIGKQSSAAGYGVQGDRRQAIQQICALAHPADTVVIAGKGHEDYQIIGTDKHYFDDRNEVKTGLMLWNRRHLLAATKGTVIAEGANAGIYAQVSTDSRTLGAAHIFVAIAGDNFDGHDFLDAAVTRGAGVLVVDRECPLPAGVLVIRVDDTLEALGALAAYRRRLLASDLLVAAITGSSGKTTVKEMTAAIFSEHFAEAHPGAEPVLKTRGNFNNLVGLPISLLPVNGGHRAAVLEMGMNRPGEIAKLSAIAEPDIVCITNVQPAHLEGLGSLSGVARAKGELFEGMKSGGTLVVNLDDQEIRRLADQVEGRRVTFSATSHGRRYNPRVRATRISDKGEQGMRFTLHIDEWSSRLSIPLPGRHSVSNSIAAAAIAVAAGIPGESIVAGLSQYRSLDKRMALTTLPGGLRVFNDTYNANPASMGAALETVAGFAARRRVAALGEMLELGTETRSAHAAVGARIAALGFDQLAVVGPSADAVADGALAGGMKPDAIHVFESVRDMAAWLYSLIKAGELGAEDWLLVKGSRGMRMETLIEETQELFSLQTDQTN